MEKIKKVTIFQCKNENWFLYRKNVITYGKYIFKVHMKNMTFRKF